MAGTMPTLSVFALLMSLFYLAMGVLFLFTNVLAEPLPHYRPAIGAAFLGYGALRLWMWFRKRKHEAQH
jgi:hypothetical protein